LKTLGLWVYELPFSDGLRPIYDDLKVDALNSGYDALKSIYDDLKSGYDG
jgi:hypothetical protein